MTDFVDDDRHAFHGLCNQIRLACIGCSNDTVVSVLAIELGKALLRQPFLYREEDLVYAKDKIDEVVNDPLADLLWGSPDIWGSDA